MGTWNVGFMNQGKFDKVKQEMARKSINISGISELKWMGMGEFNSDDYQGFHGGSDSKESTCNVGDLGLIPGLGRSPGRWYGNPLQYSLPGESSQTEKPVGSREVHGVTKSWTQLSD